MGQLSISLLGPFQVTLDQQAVTGFQSRKVQALLTILAAESERPHTREALAGLLWPDYPNSSAMTYLRNALANLRLVLDDARTRPPFLLVSRDALQLNPAADLSGDLLTFADLAGTPASSPDLPQRLQAPPGPNEVVVGVGVRGVPHGPRVLL